MIDLPVIIILVEFAVNVCVVFLLTVYDFVK